MAGGGPWDISVLSDHHLGQLYGVTKVNGILDASLLNLLCCCFVRGIIVCSLWEGELPVVVFIYSAGFWMLEGCKSYLAVLVTANF